MIVLNCRNRIRQAFRQHINNSGQVMYGNLIKINQDLGPNNYLNQLFVMNCFQIHFMLARREQNHMNYHGITRYILRARSRTVIRIRLKAEIFYLRIQQKL